VEWCAEAALAVLRPDMALLGTDSGGGEYQVSDKEREMVAGSLLKDVLFMVMERTVNPASQRPTRWA